MAKATRVHSTPRKTASKKRSTKKAVSDRSEIIRQCVLYLQSVAAYNAGFEADHGDFKIAGAGGSLGDASPKSAEKAINRLNVLSSSRGKTAKALSVTELKAKASVCETMMRFDGIHLDQVDVKYVGCFAREVATYFRDAAKSIP